MTADLPRRRAPQPSAVPAPNRAASTPLDTGHPDAHPSGKAKYGALMQVVRGVSFAVYFICSCIA